MTPSLSKLSVHKLIWLLTVLAALIAWRVMYIQHGWINDDSTLYFEMAKRFSAGEWREGWTLFQWPFYPLLIAGFHKLSTINLHLSAQILAVIFFCMTAFSLSKLIQLAGGNQLVIVCGNFLLFSSTYITGDVFAMLLRDQGFWAFFLSSLVFFIRYIRNYQWLDAILWQIMILVATLFRVEGIAYAFFLPLILFFQPHHWRFNVKQLIKANAVHLFLLTALLIILFASILDTSHLGRLNEVRELFSSNSHKSIHGLFAEKSIVLGEQVLGGFLDDYAQLSLAVSLLSIVIIKCFKVAGGLSSLLMLVARTQLLTLPQRDAQKVFLLAATVAVLNASVIIFRSFVLSSRYIVALGFLVIIFVAFYLASLIQAWQQQEKKSGWLSLILLVSAIFIFVGIIKNIANKREDHNYEQQAVAWVKNHTTDPIYYDSARLRYYADAPWVGREDAKNSATFIQSLANTPAAYTCLVMRAESDEKEKIKQLESIHQYREVKRFSNKSGNIVLILCRY